MEFSREEFEGIEPDPAGTFQTLWENNQSDMQGISRVKLEVESTHLEPENALEYIDICPDVVEPGLEIKPEDIKSDEDIVQSQWLGPIPEEIEGSAATSCIADDPLTSSTVPNPSITKGENLYICF